MYRKEFLDFCQFDPVSIHKDGWRKEVIICTKNLMVSPSTDNVRCVLQAWTNIEDADDEVLYMPRHFLRMISKVCELRVTDN